ncbi:hypothetical protein LX32DRAFT_559044 [Colletotrichum zoysiae]|uniref:Signal peptide-containing protein n=1 Tax=Colletotrichum zoysiae TaxID=1216348 RepID=A0AAD9HJN6_9PEZI|nr:hypothetical protein LX32DRAFT_559044 [Colletotrichum zoysiae]
MQFFAIPVLALFAAGTLALPNDLEARAIEARVNCGQILPACNGGRVVGQTNCRCSGQVSTCDLWSCPGPSPNVMVCGQQGSGCVWI